MMQCRKDRIGAFMLASAVAAGALLTAGCRKEPEAASPSPSLAIKGGSGSGSGSGKAPGGATAQTSPAGKAETSAPQAVTAEQLAKDFQADDSKAAAKYKDRWLVVDGTYKEAYEKKVGGTETRMVYFADYHDPSTRHSTLIGCKLDAAAYPAFDGLTPGQKIKVKALCTGGGYERVSLADGQLLEAGKDPALEVPAAQLAKEFATERKVAEMKYNDRWLLVEGTVFEANPKDKPSITLEGADEKAAKPIRVVAQFGGDREADPGKVKKGDKVRLKGKAMLYLDDGSAVLQECKVVK
jgi:hypothetical protein